MLHASTRLAFKAFVPLCLACAIAMVIVTIYSGYNCTRNLNVEKPRDHLSINTVLPTESRPLNKENASPCLKDAFKDILLVLFTIIPLYDSYLISLLCISPRSLICCSAVRHTIQLVQASSRSISTKAFWDTSVLVRAIREHPGYKGYFHISDDVILNYWKFPDFDREKIWESSFSFGLHLFMSPRALIGTGGCLRMV
ncbi:hypothetical protein OS493_040500 [Desmophyllum pertusum]|uniref:Uncharacterized protein n=1 Tax=Desmophyllum pertusum TaxID=174260 RepID=A0A9W9YKA0_9CNID|nr:hypothetical protein OS493_040500 [Desmophyllum pertusum]